MRLGGVLNRTSSPNVLTCRPGWTLALLALVHWAAAAGPAAAGETVRNDRPAFTLVVPDGYVRAAVAGDTLYAFATSDPADGPPDAAVAVQRLHGTIGREPLKLTSKSPPGSRVIAVPWRGYELSGAAARITQGDVTVATRAVQVPLRGEAVQVVVAVPAAREATADPILASFLAGLDGPTSWGPSVSESDRRTLLAVGLAGPAVLLAIVTVVVVRRARRRRALAAIPGALRVRDTRQARHGAAVRAAVWTGVVVLLVVPFGVILLVAAGVGAPPTENAEERGEQLVYGAFKMAGTGALVAYGLTRLLIRVRRGPLVYTPLPPPPPNPGGGSGHPLENIVDDGA